MSNCPRCGGTGHMPALGPLIVRAAPIERVVCSDKRPMVSDSGSEPRVWWSVYRDDQDAYCRLPLELFRLLEGGFVSAENPFRYYDSPDLANAALSAAMIAWARGVEVSSQL